MGVWAILGNGKLWKFQKFEIEEKFHDGRKS